MDSSKLRKNSSRLHLILFSCNTRSLNLIEFRVSCGTTGPETFMTRETYREVGVRVGGISTPVHGRVRDQTQTTERSHGGTRGDV